MNPSASLRSLSAVVPSLTATLVPALALLVAGCGAVDDLPGPETGPDGGMIGIPDDGEDNHDPRQLFARSSPWNSPATGRVDPSSSLMISSQSTGSLAYSFATTGRGLAIAGTDDYPDYGVPLYEVTTSAPLVQVKDKYGWWGGGYSGVPMPANATPAVGTDHHLSIWDIPNHTLYEFWEMVKNPDGTWSAGAGVKFDTRGTGYQTTPWAVSARAYGGAAIAGAIRHAEMKAGVIDHALGMAYPWTRGQAYALGLGTDGITVNIASHSDNALGADRNGAANIPEGARLRLKASVDVAARCGANRACKIIGTALKKYGMYLVDTAGVATLYAEVLTGRDVSWTGLLSITDAEVWTADDFELLSLPAALTATPPPR